MQDARPLRIVCFGNFELDLRSGELLKGGLRLKLQEQPFRVLQALVEHAGEVVLREELQREIWHGETFVDFEHGLNRAINRLRELLHDSPTAPRFIETIPKKGYRFVCPVSAKAGLSQGESISKIRLAILPFHNLSEDPLQEYFSDGLTDEMIAQVSRLNPKRLGVIARTSVLPYKHTTKSVEPIAKELRVDFLLEGSVRRSKDRVRISAQLISCRDQVQQWAETYERKLEDIFEIQEQVARQIGSALALELLPDHKEITAFNITPSAKAHEQYLLGKFMRERRTERSLMAAIRHFEDALKLDSHYALAYAELANCCATLCWNGMYAPQEGGEKAKAAACSAVQEGADLGEAHCALALVKFWYEWDWAAAEDEFTDAIRLAPSYAPTHHFYAQFLNVMGCFDDARVVQELAQALDPLSLVVAQSAAEPYLYRREYSTAIRILRNLIAREPMYESAHFDLGRCYLYSSDYEAAIRCFESSAELAGHLGAMPALGCAFALSGRRSEARAILRELKDYSARRYVAPTGMAMVLLALGEKEQALEALERAYRDRCFAMIFLEIEPLFDSLHGSSRFTSLLRRMHLYGANAHGAEA
jgi:TolB-like protein